MPLLKHIAVQTDFSSGEVNVSLKRDDEHPVKKSGLRQCANFRILNSRGLANRFGRSAQFLDGPRVDEVIMAPGSIFTLCFSAGTITVRSAGASVFTQNGYAWTANNVSQITWAVYLSQVFITFPGQQPLVLTWAGGTSFSIANYVPVTNVSTGGAGGTANQKRTFFYRISPLGVTLRPGASGPAGGTATLVFSAGMNLVAGHVGTYIRYVNRQIKIVTVTSSTTGTGLIEEPLPQTQRLVADSAANLANFEVGDEVIGSVSGAKAVVTSFPGGGNFLAVVSINGVNFISDGTDYIVGPAGSMRSVSTTSNVWLSVPDPVQVWDDEVMNTFRGWPAACFVDQNRLGFCNFPAVPSGIGWSAIGNVTDLYVPQNQITADNAIFELVPGKSQVLYVRAGAESSEFVFCDNSVYWIPISAQIPLAPGSIAFNRIDEGCAAVQPQRQKGTIFYLNSGNNMVRAICATGAYNRPYESRSLTDFHSHLFKGLSPVAIACPTADDPQFPERYFYVLLGNGNAVACRVEIEDGQIKSPPGWFPINGVGSINWISARDGSPNVWFATTYPGASGPMAELLDGTQYLDGAFLANVPPTALTPPGGKGPLYWAPSQPVTLMDLGTRQLGLYQVDANGFIIPQGIGGENLTSAQLVAGQQWTATAEPFVASPPAGQDIQQRMTKRQVANFAVYVINSTGFLLVRMFSGPLTRTSVALGTIVGTRRVTTYNQDDDATQPPPLREEVQLWRPMGASFDPRIAIIKDTAGPLTIAEVAIEVSV